MRKTVINLDLRPVCTYGIRPEFQSWEHHKPEWSMDGAEVGCLDATIHIPAGYCFKSGLHGDTDYVYDAITFRPE